MVVEYAFLTIFLGHKNGGECIKTRIVMKVKIEDQAMAALYIEWIKEFSEELAAMAAKLHFSDDSFQNAIVETSVAALMIHEPALAALAPKVLYTEMDIEKEVFVVVMEYLDNDRFSHVYSTQKEHKNDKWTDPDLLQALKDIASLHSSFMDRMEDLTKTLPTCIQYDSKVIPKHLEFHQGQLKFDIRDFPSVFTPDRAPIVQKVFDNIANTFNVLNKAKKTLCHNEFSYRNACLRRDPQNGERHLCAYDWEFAQINVPQRDIAEFLAYALSREDYVTKSAQFVEYYRKELYNALCKRSVKLAEEVTAPEAFYELYDMSVFQYSFCWLPILSMVARHPGAGFTREMYECLTENILTHISRVAHKYN